MAPGVGVSAVRRPCGAGAAPPPLALGGPPPQARGVPGHAVADDARIHLSCPGSSARRQVRRGSVWAPSSNPPLEAIADSARPPCSAPARSPESRDPFVQIVPEAGRWSWESRRSKRWLFSLGHRSQSKGLGRRSVASAHRSGAPWLGDPSLHRSPQRTTKRGATSRMSSRNAIASGGRRPGRRRGVATPTSDRLRASHWATPRPVTGERETGRRVDRTLMAQGTHPLVVALEPPPLWMHT